MASDTQLPPVTTLASRGPSLPPNTSHIRFIPRFFGSNKSSLRRAQPPILQLSTVRHPKWRSLVSERCCSQDMACVIHQAISSAEYPLILTDMPMRKIGLGDWVHIRGICGLVQVEKIARMTHDHIILRFTRETPHIDGDIYIALPHNATKLSPATKFKFDRRRGSGRLKVEQELNGIFLYHPAKGSLLHKSQVQ